MTRILAAVLLLCSFAHATAYYLANASTTPAGSDSNSGTDAAHPWLSPNHAVNCGDTITAAASTAYSHTNFVQGKWGTVTCGAGNNVAWLICATFDACKLTATTSQGMWIDQSYWGVQGWEITVTTYGYGTCLNVSPNTTTPVELHHIVIANNVFNGCMGGGTGISNHGTVSVDYFAAVGNIAWNAAQGSNDCYSGFSVYQPKAYDSLPGTHIFVAGNFSYDNLDPNPCASAVPTDGEGIILDTLDGGQGLGTAYAQQVVVENNLVFLNGGRGIEVSGHGNSAAPIYFLHNTAYGDNGDTNQSQYFCADISMGGTNGTVYTQGAYNIAQANINTGCGGLSPVYAWTVDNSATGNVVYNNWIVGVGGDDTKVYNSGSFAYGPGNTIGTSAAFVSVADPGAPSCGSATNVPNCMATVIANFTPTTAAAIGYGYQVPSSTIVYDPLYPQWLCTVTNLPSGLVTPGCLTGTSLGNATMSNGAAH